jgi:hypothetical protein
MSFADAAFDALLDKGTLDSLICSPDALTSVTQALHECFRSVVVVFNGALKKHAPCRRS